MAARVLSTARRQAERAEKVLDRLEALHPETETMLVYRDAFTLLVATMLSAQCTDERVNLVTPALFAAFPDTRAFAAAKPEQLYPYIRSCGLYRHKAGNIVRAAKLLVARHGGEVPATREALEALPGVGRKTASCVLANVFGQPEIAVDTHVGRVARRLGFSQAQNPDEVERDLCAVIPLERRARAHHALIWHGRRVCKARNPACDSCVVAGLCKKVGV